MGEKRKGGAKDNFLFNLWAKAKAKADAQAGTAADGDGAAAGQDAAGDGKSLYLYWQEWQQGMDPNSGGEEEYGQREKELFHDCPPDEYAWSEDREALNTQLQNAARAVPAKGAVDASPAVFLSQDKLVAWLFLFPPLRGGRDIEAGAVIEAVSGKNISFGVDQQRLQAAIQSKEYFKICTVARGALPGREGRVIDCVEREYTAKMAQDDHGVVDYKSLNLFQNVALGEVICRIVKPVDAAAGRDVCGASVPGRPGKPAPIPRGENTEITPDGTALIATKGGHILFENGAFQVQNVLVVEGDVDNAVGNIDYMGDVIVKGDIREGFSVTANGDVMVEGMSEDAVLVAGGCVAIAKGMNGNGNGRIEAGGEVKCKYLENCTVYAGQNIFAESIICCEVLCDASVKVLSGKGVIIGGSLTVLGSIETKAIGSKSNRVTEVLLGATPKLIEHKDQLGRDLAQLRADLAEVIKDIAYMEKNEQSLNAQRSALLEEMRAQKPILATKEGQMASRLEKMEQDIDNVGACRILCDAIYPRTKITIGHDSLPILEIVENCMVYYSGGKVVLGQKS